MNIHDEHYDVLVRTPMVCQNGHHRWLYHSISQGDARTIWGPKKCECPVGEIGEGFMASGPSQSESWDEANRRISGEEGRIEAIEKFVDEILGLDDDMIITHIVIALERIVKYLADKGRT